MDAMESSRLTENQETLTFPAAWPSGVHLQHVCEHMHLLKNVGKTCALEYARESRRREIVPGPEGEQHSQFALERCARMR